VNSDVIDDFRLHFNFPLPSELLQKVNKGQMWVNLEL